MIPNEAGGKPTPWLVSKEWRPWCAALRALRAEQLLDDQVNSAIYDNMRNASITTKAPLRLDYDPWGWGIPWASIQHANAQWHSANAIIEKLLGHLNRHAAPASAERAQKPARARPPP